MVVIANTKGYLQSDWVRGVQYWLYLHCFQKGLSNKSEKYGKLGKYWPYIQNHN